VLARGGGNSRKGVGVECVGDGHGLEGQWETGFVTNRRARDLWGPQSIEMVEPDLGGEGKGKRGKKENSGCSKQVFQNCAPTSSHMAKRGGRRGGERGKRSGRFLPK